MPFAVGADVFVASLQKKGRIIEATASGRYRVAVGVLVLWCDEGQLSSMAQARKKGRRERDAAQAGGATASSSALAHEPTEQELRALGSIDLHGMTVEEALRAVEARLDRAIRGGLDRLEIIHGISGGRLRAAVRGYLAGIPSVTRFEPDARNAGVTWVYF
jgi:dsDNA-specific endonuclease/ATPase MutS2